MTDKSAQTNPSPDSGDSQDKGAHHLGSCLLFGVLVVVGLVVSYALSFAFTMSSDACTGGTTGWICEAPGQQLAFWLPWIALVLAIACALTGFAFSSRSDYAPMAGIGVGILVYIIVNALVYGAINAVISR
ncbi:hypothetical protein BJF85_05165 [Saccharomonospora sp. CUA-673]|uniref:hypothetical protein n=1 Tax=Saccharomonospora sp. CUA-673 TaxID=1904969 RepID=UPI00096489FB|nr:hypothetical protein [Saccharomonospora sp. CUA-673]OLT40570.1 hypothetical protein BJF85_05165 [Saccharomonospora sp. CUA-673]